MPTLIDRKVGGSAAMALAAHGAVVVRVLHGHGTDHARHRDADRGGGDRRARRDPAGGDVSAGSAVRMVIDALYTAATVASLLLIIMCSAVMFSQLLTVTGAARTLGDLVVHLNLPAPLMVFMMMAVPFVLFMFLDQIALMLVLVPIYQPIIKIYGFDDIWFWTLFLIVATVGGLTPPFGYVLFALKSAAPDVPIRTIYRASWPFVWIICVGMVVFAVFPDLIMLLPRLMGPH